MTEIDNWLERYGESHQELRNPVVFWASVPMVVLGTVGIFWALPIPLDFLEISPLLNWGSAFMMATAIYEYIIALSLAIGMLPFLLGVAAAQLWLAQSPYPAIGVSIGLLAAGTVGLFLGRGGPGRIRRVLEDFQLMMIGPVWLLSILYKRFGVPF